PAGDVSTAANVVAALQALPGVDATTEAISVDGRPATLVTLTAHPDTTTCLGNGATIWQTMDGSDYTISPGQVVQLRVIDVDGMPVVLMTSDFPESSHWENQAPGATPNPTA